MQPNLIGGFLMLILMIVAIVAVEFQRRGSWEVSTSKTKIDSNATIVNMSHEKLGRTNTSATLRTTVYFSDGYTFVCNKYDIVHKGIISYMCIKPETMDEIIKTANEAHQKAVTKQKTKV